jgi:hypothetical protein
LYAFFFSLVIHDIKLARICRFPLVFKVWMCMCIKSAIWTVEEAQSPFFSVAVEPLTMFQQVFPWNNCMPTW